MIRWFKIDVVIFLDIFGMMLVMVEVFKDLGGLVMIQEFDEKVIELEGVIEVEQVFIMFCDESWMRVNYYFVWVWIYLKCGDVLNNFKCGVWVLIELGFVIFDLSVM